MKIKINPNEDHVRRVREALKLNDGYCPCKLVKIADNKCTCLEFLQQEEGMCHCGLYIKVKEEKDI